MIRAPEKLCAPLSAFVARRNRAGRADAQNAADGSDMKLADPRRAGDGGARREVRHMSEQIAPGDAARPLVLAVSPQFRVGYRLPAFPSGDRLDCSATICRAGARLVA